MQLDFSLKPDFSPPSVSLFAEVKWLSIFDRLKQKKLVLLFTILNNPDAPALCLKHKFNFSSSVRLTGLRSRAGAFNLQVPYPRSNSEKRTLAYSAATLLNCLDTDLTQIDPSSLGILASQVARRSLLRACFSLFGLVIIAGSRK